MTKGPKVKPVLITAPASRSGKDYIANYIANYFQTTPKFEGHYVIAKKFKFATKLKQVVQELFKHRGVKSAALYESFGALRKTKLNGLDNVTVVDLWISMGEHLREIDPTVWANQLVREVREHIKEVAPHAIMQATWENGLKESMPVIYVPVISDWRMELEGEYIADKLGKPITICVTAQNSVTLKADGRIPEEQIQHTLVNCKTLTFENLIYEWLHNEFVQALALGSN